MEFRLFSKIDHALGPEQLHQPLARDDFTGMRQQFEQAVESLKARGHGSGARALYSLPWYVIIGPPGAGKSTVFRLVVGEVPRAVEQDQRADPGHDEGHDPLQRAHRERQL